jgi:hypothetical protein
VDGDMSTRWRARDDRDEWLRIDLGSTHTIDEVVVKWHSSDYAEDYRVRVSQDRYNWDTVERYENRDGGTITTTFSARSARYVLIDCEKARDDDGFSIYEVEVYARDSSSGSDTSSDGYSSYDRDAWSWRG